MDTHPVSNRLIMDRKHWCHTVSLTFMGSKTLDETQDRSKAGLQVRMQDHGAGDLGTSHR